MRRFGPWRIFTNKEIRQQIACLEALASDLEGLVDAPIATVTSVVESFLDSPFLNEWRFSTRPVVCLEGMSTGPPLLPGARRSIRTSELWLISEKLGWAITYSQWYALGDRCDSLSERH